MNAKSASQASTDPGYSRLHITPLDPQLLEVIVPAAVLPTARRISYHSIQTFPDKRYGFLDLPIADAVKIKNKLNGATLRGAKIHIQPARPENMPQPFPDAIVAADAATESSNSRSEKKDKKDKKRKRDNLEIVGVELEDGRKVKRGWTITPEDAHAKKKAVKAEDRRRSKSENTEPKKKTNKRREQESQYTDGPEALIKTRLPPNKLDDSTAQAKKTPKRKKNRDMVVHEFEHNTKFATFLKATQPTPATGTAEASFVEGKGWVKEDGTVLEELKSTRPRTIPTLQVNSISLSHQTTEQDDDTSSSSGSSSEENGSIAQATVEPDFTGSAARPKSAGSMRSLTIQIPVTPTSVSTKLHPLEALYKRQKPGEADAADAKLASSGSEVFTFGNGLDDDVVVEEDEEGEATSNADRPEPSQGTLIPMTPYSKQDFEWRTTRSAAPTPDTAHPSRISRIWSLGGEDDALEDVQEDREGDDEDDRLGDMEEVETGEDGEEQVDKYKDFQAWFWKNRGNLDRAWRERRRAARKEKRHRDNKAKEDRAI